MTARKATAKAAEDTPPGAEADPDESAAASVDEVHVRGGWDVGYIGDRVDDADDNAYTVAGVLPPAGDDE